MKLRLRDNKHADKMNEPESPAPRKPLGDALQWTDAEIESMSQITDKDIELAKRWWEKHAPENAKRLLDAKPTKRRRKSKKKKQT